MAEQEKKAKKGSISFRVLTHIAFRNLVNKKLRTFLTIFGVVIGIGAIFFLLSFGLGLQNLVTSQIIGNQSIKSIDISTPNSRILKLDQDSFNKVKNLPHVGTIGASYSFPGSLKLQGSEVDTIVYGVDENYQVMSNLSVSKGRLLKKTDTKSVLVNNSLLESIGIKDAKNAINKKLEIRIPLRSGSADKTEMSDTYTVIGVIDSGSGSEVFMPNAEFQVAGVKVYNQIKIEADKSENVNPLRRQIESLGFATSSPIDTVDQVNQIFKFFNFILVGFGAIGMIVAVLGMFNTLTISLLERTREIGLMMALGGRNRDMRKLFIFEAVLLSIAGAIIGIIGAVIVGKVLNVILNNYAHHRGVSQNFTLFATPLWLVALMIGFMVIVGLLVVFFPSRRAAHINPIDALRRE